MKFLISGVGGPAGASLRAQLQERGHEVIGCDLAPGAGDLACPRADSLDLVPFLRAAVLRHRVDVFVPTVQDELLAVAVAAPVIGARMVVSDARAVGIAADKWLSAVCLAQRGVAVPRTYPVDAPAEFAYPLVVKPRVSRGGRGVQVVESAAELPALDHSLLVQEFAPGAEFCPQLYIGADGHITSVVLRKTALKEGRVGNAAAVVRDTDTAVDALARQVAQALGLRGPVDMDIRYTAAGKPVLLEVNARFGANSAHAPELLDALLAEVS